jgi:hypothetical protein
MSTYLGWHFLPRNRRLANLGGKQLEPGDVVEHDGPMELCRCGLHWSERIIDAIKYAPGPWCCRIEASGETVFGDEKSISRRRKILWMVDTTDLVLDWFADVQEDWILMLQEYGKSWPELDRYGEMCSQYREGNATTRECYRDARDARDASMDALGAWGVRDAATMDTRDAWYARAASVWAARDARGAWAARYARDAWYARAAVVWDARDARDAWYASVWAARATARDTAWYAARAARLEAMVIAEHRRGV